MDRNVFLKLGVSTLALLPTLQKSSNWGRVAEPVDIIITCFRSNKSIINKFLKQEGYIVRPAHWSAIRESNRVFIQSVATRTGKGEYRYYGPFICVSSRTSKNKTSKGFRMVQGYNYGSYIERPKKPWNVDMIACTIHKA